MGGRVLPQTGGFTDKVGLVDRTIVVTGIPFGADEMLGLGCLGLSGLGL